MYIEINRGSILDKKVTLFVHNDGKKYKITCEQPGCESETIYLMDQTVAHGMFINLTLLNKIA